ncbi:Ppx/GppA family phosphatase [Corynebacterium sp. ES2730-CONJ]|uniref:Ppx/GppA phosphatase family protein n=1 Tax=Corynebacterium sp. ES2730-CONJ TaxID=2973941 RepID=UPI00216B159F|nr:Ppx/GppA phosphatase family protein [Corynebacterium sp. ES2730-CONJ]MCS4531795.1 Ppx/GppA family phosphatase [Corynebacterium sp. ES2730-CONJ]
MTRYAAIDCGTNSLRLLIVECTRDGDIKEIARQMEIVRLGAAVDATGEFDPAAIERARLVLARYVDIMRAERVADIRMVATSATRDAKNREVFFDMTRTELAPIREGAVAEVISGDEEAQLSFAGAVADLNPDRGPFCVIDLGGGSTEFVVGYPHGKILGSYSAQMGCVRLSERILHTDPPTDKEQLQAAEYISQQLRDVRNAVPISQARTFVGCAGTFTTLAALALGLETYDATKIHNTTLRFPALKVLNKELIGLSSAERRMNPVIHPGRADVLAGGGLVVNAIIDMIAYITNISQITISEKDILDGIILGMISSKSSP